jgi:histidine triad (HIT) family protein
LACIFCEIIAGRAEASRVYEDDLIVAFLGIRPVRPGMLCVIPKEHTDHFCDIPEPLALHIMKHTQRLSRVIRESLKPLRVGLVVSGFGVAHAHMIIVPLHDTQDITSSQYAHLEDGQIKFGEQHLPLLSRQELDALAALLREQDTKFAKREHLVGGLIARYLEGPDALSVCDIVKTNNALPVYADMGGILFLRPNGEILCLPDDGSSLKPETDLSWCTIALVSAAEKYPELSFLLPPRPETAKDCSDCQGTGKIKIHQIAYAGCSRCNTLGWVA